MADKESAESKHNQKSPTKAGGVAAPDGTEILNKTGLGEPTSRGPSAGLKRPLAEELNLKMRDTYASPVLGLKYSHEILQEKYIKGVLAQKEARYREILEGIKQKAKPIDHEGLKKHDADYMATRMRKKELREEEIRRHVYEFHHSDYKPVKSQAYLRVSKEEYQNPALQKLEKAKRANETKKQYSSIVKDIFFKDALLAAQRVHERASSSTKLKPEAVSLRDIKLEADKKRKEEAEKQKRMQELGNEYLAHVRKLNEKTTPEMRVALEKKRFETLQVPTPRNRKNRKYLDDIAREFTEPRDVVFQKDLLKRLNPSVSSAAKGAYLENVKNFDQHIELKALRERYGVPGSHAKGAEVGDLYVTSIANKLDTLQKEVGFKEASKKGSSADKELFSDPFKSGAAKKNTSPAGLKQSGVADPKSSQMGVGSSKVAGQGAGPGTK